MSSCPVLLEFSTLTVAEPAASVLSPVLCAYITDNPEPAFRRFRRVGGYLHSDLIGARIADRVNGVTKQENCLSNY